MNKFKLTVFKESKLNEYITLKLLGNHRYKDIVLYLDEMYFMQCMRLLVNINNHNSDKINKVDSIDELFEFREEQIEDNIDITPEQEFLGHCSNLQAWIENSYDTRILASNISFRLLEALVNLRDTIAKRVFKDEIAHRLESGYLPTVKFLFYNHYLDYFEDTEILSMSENIRNPYIQKFLKDYVTMEQSWFKTKYRRLFSRD